MKGRKDHRAIFIRCDPAFLAEIEAAAAQQPFAGNVAGFSRDAILKAVQLRKALGPRFELEIARLLESANEREGVAA